MSERSFTDPVVCVPRPKAWSDVLVPDVRDTHRHFISLTQALIFFCHILLSVLTLT